MIQVRRQQEQEDEIEAAKRSGEEEASGGRKRPNTIGNGRSVARKGPEICRVLVVQVKARMLSLDPQTTPACRYGPKKADASLLRAVKKTDQSLITHRQKMMGLIEIAPKRP